jgi:hypothetical protein
MTTKDIPSKISRATVSLEKEGKRKRTRIIKDALNQEGKHEIDQYQRRRGDSDESTDCLRRSEESIRNVW